MIKVQINNICAKLVECEPLTSGMIGKLVGVSFSAEWDSLNKIAVFSNGDVTKDLFESQWNGNYIPIPREVLATPHRTISMGVYGYEIVDGEKVLAIPTIVAEIGKTKFGADPSDDPAADPTLPIWAQLQWEIDHFEIPDEQIAIQVQAYLAEHPIEIQPATASVLGGVKVGEGLSVTSDGTLSTEVTAEDIDELANIVDGKQGEIADLNTIRSGAALGATAVQPDDLDDYALKSDLPYVTPEDFGAVGDGVADDTEAIQNMVDSGYNIKCQKKTYKITDTITFENHSSRYRTCDFEAAHIVYTGNSYAFKFTRSNNAVLKFGRITANSGGCLHMYSDASANSIQYVDVYFFELTAATNCIFIEQAATAGWINQVNFYNGRFAGGTNGCLASGSMNHINWYNIGVEGVTNGFNLDSKFTGITRWSFINCRYEESFTKFIVATGAVTGVTIIGGRGFSTSHYTVNSQCDKWIIFGSNNYPADNPLATVTYLIKGSFISNNNAYNSLAGGIQIQNGDDLNAYTNVGNYYSASNAITNSLLHKPSGSSLGVFKLEVMDLTGRWNASDKFLLQTIHSRNTVSVYIRAYYDNSWKTWREYRTDSETYIDNGANLNSLTNIGTYYCASNSIAASLLNAPSGLNKIFQLRVIPLANSNRDATYQYYIQEINQAERTYRRNMACENNVWSFGEWVAFDPSTYATEAWVDNQGFIKQHQSLAAYRTASAQDAIDSGFVKLVGAAGQTIQTNVAVPLNVKNNIVLQHRAFVGFHTHDDNAIGFIGVDSGKPTFLAADGVTAKALQGETIADSAGYFTTDTVEGALAEIGAELSGINTLVGSGVIV